MVQSLAASPILLAPAGSLPALEAALSAGADAVYVGIRSLSRGGRSGIPLEEAGPAADTCRKAGARLHAAVNAVPFSGGMPALLAAVARLREAGVAEVILNDPGLIVLVRRRFPGLPICASVGLSAVNPEDAVAYRELGADAIVLPSAVRPEEVPAIKRASGLRIEVFGWCRPEFLLHGKCGLTGYAAEGAGGETASAKRGGSCRLVCRELPVPREPRTLEDELPAWIEAGVDVVKIEGRELPPAAVRGIVARFRAKIDAAVPLSAGR
ncbi:MAG: U32 family peptidase [Deltaproteobacteria bacterium]|nr:MAG: U32 family peptidase [Deltaproteobacteria bacterium]